MHLNVASRNPNRLDEVCRGLADTASQASDYQSASEAAHALSYVRDPIAVPHLARVLRESKQVKEGAIPGLVRIGNAEAVKVLTENLNAQDADLKALIIGGLKEIKTGVHPTVVD
jgi:HEAT repeat protein